MSDSMDSNGYFTVDVKGTGFGPGPTIAIFDAMLASIMEITDYSLEQFALIHPGGAVGSRLNG